MPAGELRLGSAAVYLSDGALLVPSEFRCVLLCCCLLPPPAAAARGWLPMLPLCGWGLLSTRLLRTTVGACDGCAAPAAARTLTAAAATAAVPRAPQGAAGRARPFRGAARPCGDRGGGGQRASRWRGGGGGRRRRRAQYQQGAQMGSAAARGAASLGHRRVGQAGGQAGRHSVAQCGNISSMA